MPNNMTHAEYVAKLREALRHAMDCPHWEGCLDCMIARAALAIEPPAPSPDVLSAADALADALEYAIKGHRETGNLFLNNPITHLAAYRAARQSQEVKG